MHLTVPGHGRLDRITQADALDLVLGQLPVTITCEGIRGCASTASIRRDADGAPDLDVIERLGWLILGHYRVDGAVAHVDGEPLWGLRAVCPGCREQALAATLMLGRYESAVRQNPAQPALHTCSDGHKHCSPVRKGACMHRVYEAIECRDCDGTDEPFCLDSCRTCGGTGHAPWLLRVAA